MARRAARPTASAATSSASCSTASTSETERLLDRLRRRAHRPRPRLRRRLLHGAAKLPSEADERAAALTLADRRLYSEKFERRRDAISEQTCDALLQVLHEREPDLRDHVGDVAELALRVGIRLGLKAEELDDVRRAAELHDVGKSAVPDAILAKPGPLDEREWEFVRQHTLVGERILRAAPALHSVAKLVRSSHERFDGTGYPDGLVGQTIPLGARIVSACDAWDAMITTRPYRKAMSAGRRARGAAPLQRHAVRPGGRAGAVRRGGRARRTSARTAAA